MTHATGASEGPYVCVFTQCDQVIPCLEKALVKLCVFRSWSGHLIFAYNGIRDDFIHCTPFDYSMNCRPSALSISS